jgi:hypothetical protein
LYVAGAATVNMKLPVFKVSLMQSHSVTAMIQVQEHLPAVWML